MNYFAKSELNNSIFVCLLCHCLCTRMFVIVLMFEARQTETGAGRLNDGYLNQWLVNPILNE